MGGEDRLGRVPSDREAVLRLAERHLGERRDLVAAPLLHDTPDEIAQPLGEVRDWRAGECEPSRAGRCRSCWWSSATTRT